jgi:hypothetical protein
VVVSTAFGASVICITQDREFQTHIHSVTDRYSRENKMMNCHYINTQLERIQQAKVGAGERLSIGGSSGLEEQLRAIEVAVSSIRDEMWRRSGPCR